jgi:branched-chain amino acid transport system ATP-binding protein
LAVTNNDLLSITDLQVKYGNVQVIHGVNINVKAGSVVCVLGSNGAGKSSIVRAILGLAPVSGGSIYFDGKKISGLATHEITSSGISIVPEGRGVFPSLTVEENLRTGYIFFKKDTSELNDRYEEAYQRYPILGKRRTQQAGTLSGGEQSMLALSRALMVRPKILLLDEPSLGLAPNLVDATFSRVEELRSEGLSVLLIEQNAVKALKVSDSGYILQKGLVVASGLQKELMGNEAVHRAYFGLE